MGLVRPPCYVVGYMFNDEGTEVALILKDHPPEQAGLLNGIGGKVNLLEDNQMAMLREFQEETGVTAMDMVTKATELWQHTIYLQGTTWEVHYFRAFSSPIIEELKVKRDWPTNEPVIVVPTRSLPGNLYNHVEWTLAISIAPGVKFPFRVDDTTPPVYEDGEILVCPWNCGWYDTEMANLDACPKCQGSFASRKPFSWKTARRNDD